MIPKLVKQYPLFFACLGMAAAAGFGAAVGLGRLDVGVRVALILVAVVAGVFLVPLVLLFGSIAVHELGHLVVGLLVGMRFRSITVCGLTLRQTSEGLRWAHDSSLSNSGEVRMDFPTRGNALNRYRLHVLGGPLATLVLLAVTGYYLVVLFRDPTVWASLGVDRLALLATFFINLCIAGYSVNPMTMQGVANDAQILALLSRPDANRTVALTQLTILVRDGVRAKDWPNQLLTTAVSVEDRSEYEASARYYNFYHLLDTDNPSRAWEQIDEATEIILAQVNVSDDVKLGFLIERAFAAAWAKRDLALAQRLVSELAGVEVPDRSSTGILRLRAAVALLEEQPDAALMHLSHFDEAIDATELLIGWRVATDRAFVEAMRAEAIEMAARLRE